MSTPIVVLSFILLILDDPGAIDSNPANSADIEALKSGFEYRANSILSFTFKRNSTIDPQSSIARMRVTGEPGKGHALTLNGCKYRIREHRHHFSRYFVEAAASLTQPKMEALAAEMSESEEDTLFLRLLTRFLTYAFAEVSEENLVFQGEISSAMYIRGGKPPRDPFACSDAERKGIALVDLPAKADAEFMVFLMEPLVPITDFSAETFIVAGMLDAA